MALQTLKGFDLIWLNKNKVCNYIYQHNIIHILTLLNPVREYNINQVRLQTKTYATNNSNLPLHRITTTLSLRQRTKETEENQNDLGAGMIRPTLRIIKSFVIFLLKYH